MTNNDNFHTRRAQSILASRFVLDDDDDPDDDEDDDEDDVDNDEDDEDEEGGDSDVETWQVCRAASYRV